MKHARLVVIAAVLALAAGFFSCATPEGRYVGYRLAPDRAPVGRDRVVEVPDLDAEVTILLDEYGVPYIRAGSESALYYGMGYMQGRDRRFQIEMLKLLALGRVREMIGDSDPSGVMKRMEKFSRLIGLYRDADKVLENASPENAALLDAFAAGVNAATAAEPVPMEFELLGYTPEPWEARDSGVIIAMTAFGLFKNWEVETIRLELILHQLRTGGSVERALAIWKPRFELPPHIVGEKPAEDPFADVPPIAPEVAEYLEEFARKHPTPIDRVPEADASLSKSPLSGFLHGMNASNNWAVGGEWTGTGKGGYSSDPHMPHLLPPLGYLHRIECDGCEGGSYRVVGGTFAGLPGVFFGTNGHVAWGSTSNWADSSDIVVEKPVPGRPEYVMFGDAAEPMKKRVEVFKIRQPDGTFATEEATVYSTRHGVIVNDVVERVGEGYPLLALRRMPIGGRPLKAMHGIYTARDVDEARAALFDFYAQVGHWSLADTKGNVAYTGTVRLPERHGYLGTTPVAGWTGTYEWEAFRSIEELPWVKNPQAGFLGTANNQVIQPESYDVPVNFEGDKQHRFERIRRVLAKGRMDQSVVERMAALEMDGVDLGWEELRPVYTPILTRIVQGAKEPAASAAAALLAWDGRCVPDAVGCSVFHSLNAHLIRRNMKDEVNPVTLKFILNYFNAEPFVYDLLGDPDNPAWDDRSTPAIETRERVIADGFAETVTAMAKRYGGDVPAWKWSRVAPFHLEHPFGGEKGLTKYLNRGPLPTQGAGNSVFKHQFVRSSLTRFPIKYGPVLRVAIDLNDLAASRMSLPGGQSGRPASRNYDDLLPLFLKGGGIPMDMDAESVEKRAVGRIELVPLAQ